VSLEKKLKAVHAASKRQYTATGRDVLLLCRCNNEGRQNKETDTRSNKANAFLCEFYRSMAVVPKLFLIAYYLWVPYCQHVPPCSRKSQCAKYHSIKGLENQN